MTNSDWRQQKNVLTASYYQEVGQVSELLLVRDLTRYAQESWLK